MNSKVLSILARRVLLLVVGFGFYGASYADNPAITHNRANLPIPCAGGCGAGNLSWVGDSNAVTWNYAANNASKMVVTQQAEKAILNWQSFNIGRNNSVEFVQPSAASEILNRIHDADPSSIAGTLTSNGQIYLLNQNGIVFKDGAQINVGGLIASTLGMNDAIFQKGILSVTSETPIFGGGGYGDILVGKGAYLTTGPGGRIMLVAPNVTNEGLIETPDGQTVLAAGAKVYVESGQGIRADLKINGLVVEVDGGGKAVNLGDILVGTGDAELVGLAVQQAGRISARTSVSTNGTIRLLARDSVVNAGTSADDYWPKATRGGDLVLGNHSLTEISLDLNYKATSVDEEAYIKSENGFVKDNAGRLARIVVSKIQLQGKNVELAEDSRVVAPSGLIDVVAALNPSEAGTYGMPEVDPASGDKRLVGIRLGKNAVVDVAGLTSAELEMSRNFVDVELRANELKDAPLQRDGVLRGEKVTIDVRTVDENGSIPLADVSGAVALIGRTVEERSAVGGTIVLNSHGEIVSAPQARLDVSGGAITYRGGVVGTTKVISGASLFDIGNAPADLIYDRILGGDELESNKWRIKYGGQGTYGKYEAGYVEGKDAGTINLVAPSFRWQGDIIGSRVTGAYQREHSISPVAASLTVGRSAGQDEAVANFVTESIRLQSQSDLQGGSNSFDTEMLGRSGLGSVSMFSNGAITLGQGAPLTLPAGGALKLHASQVQLLSNVVVPGGAVDVTSRVTVSASAGSFGNLSLAAGARISTSGDWTNDSLLDVGMGSFVASLNGGSIKLTAAKDLLLAESSVLDVQGGAWLRTDGTLQKGKGGSISLATRSVDSKFELGSQLSGFGFGVGGALNLTTTKIDILANLDQDSERAQFRPEFFGANGFSKISLSANAGDLLIEDKVEISPQLRTRIVRTDYRRFGTGTSLEHVGEVVVLSDDLRTPISLSFSATSAAPNLVPNDYGKVRLGDGAKIIGEAEAAISLTSNYQLEVLGEIAVPAGSIDLKVDRVKSGSGDERYYAQQGLWLGANSVLEANGVERVRRSGVHTVRSVLDAGSISLMANAGYLMIEPGASVNVSAAKGTADMVMRGGSLPHGVPSTGRAGRIKIAAVESAFINNGDLQARAADSGTPGGEFELTFGRGVGFDNSFGFFPTDVRRIVLQHDWEDIPDLTLLDKLPNALNGVARVDVSRLSAAGFDSVKMINGDENGIIQIGSNLDWRVPGSLILDAPRLVNSAGIVASIGANYVSLGNSELGRQKHSNLPNSGNAKLSVHGQWVDLIGSIVVDGAASVALTADRDLRLIGVVKSATTTPSAELEGKLVLAGDLKIDAARVYPATRTNFMIEVTGPDTRRVRFDGAGSAGSTSGEILSAAGRLVVKAPVIEQFGDLRAPHGIIEFEAGRTLDLGPTSNTSVAGGALPVPFGGLVNGKEWTYNFGDNGGLSVLTVPPEKRIRLDSPKVSIDAGAVLDVSGGGDLSAFEFLPGPGGSVDVLMGKDIFAVLPSVGNALAPYDFQYSLDASYSPNRVVNLTGVPNLVDGLYTLLPGHYGLLPGAFLVREVKSLPGLIPGRSAAQADGSVLIAGRSTRSGSLLFDDKLVTYRVSPGILARQQSEFVVKTAGQVFAELSHTGEATIPADAGTIVVAARDSLRMDGVVRAEHGLDSIGAQIDILAPDIRIVASGLPVTADGRLVLDTGTIARFGAADLLFGGERKAGEGNVTVEIGATRITVDPNVHLEGEAITLVARDEIRLEHGAQLDSIGDGRKGEHQKWVIGIAKNTGSGDGALLRVSSGVNAQLTRNEVNGERGSLVLERDSLVQGRNVILDITSDLRVDGRVEASDSLAIGVRRFLFGNAPADAEGTPLSAELTRNWARLDEVTLRSYSSVDFYGDVTLGSNSLKKLIVDSPLIRAAGTASQQDVRLTAAELILRGGKGKLAEANVVGDRKLTVSANILGLAGDNSLLEGFSEVVFDVAKELVATDTGSLQIQGDVSITTPIITTATAVDYDVVSLAGLEIIARPSDSDRPEGLGGRLTLTAANVVDDGLIDLPSGYVTLTATGVDGVTVGQNGVIRTAGQHRPLLDGAAFETPGGEVKLHAEQGDLVVDGSALIDASGGGAGADAGRVVFSAPKGTVSIGGTVNGAAGVGGRGGEVVVDAKGIVEIGALAQRLSNSGFTAAQSYRLRDGDLLVGPGVAVAAGELLFSVDNGALRVDGALQAIRPRDGSVRLVARNDVSVNQGAVIRAGATDDEAAGVVELYSTDGRIRIGDGSRIEVGSNKKGGVLRLIAGSAIGANIKIDRLPRDSLVNVADLVVVGMIDESGKAQKGIIDAKVQDSIRKDLVVFGAGVEAQREELLVLGELPALRIVPGVFVNVQGDLSLVTYWDLAKWRFGDVATGAEAGLLVLRASGNLALKNSLSDGFVAVSDDNKTGLLAGPTWSYRLVAGADKNAADEMVVVGVSAFDSKAPKQTVTVQASKWVRTGQGDIRIAAGEDIVLAGSGATLAAVYTAGTPSKPLDGFSPPQVLSVELSYPQNGGDVQLSASHDIRSGATKQLYTQWMRRGDANADDAMLVGAWGISFADFRQGVAALAGGDVTIAAGNDVVQLSASVPTVGRSVPGSTVYEVLNGGDLKIRAGNDVLSGLFYVGRGKLEVRSGGKVDRAPFGEKEVIPKDSSRRLSALFAVGEGSVDVRARRGVTVDSVINPTILAQGSLVSITGKNSFFTYREDTAVSVFSLTGNVSFINGTLEIRYYDTKADNPSPFYPGNLRVTAPVGDIAIKDTLNIMPTSRGQLTLLAGHDLLAGVNAQPGQPGVFISDADPSRLPTQEKPISLTVDLWKELAISTHAQQPAHLGDTVPVEVVAGNDVKGGIYVSKALQVTAGRDVVNLDVRAQNFAATDVSEINAGRDVLFSTSRNKLGVVESNARGIRIDGPGSLFVLAGRDVDLGTSAGIVSNGNVRNPALADRGADVFVYVGLAADYVDWLQQAIQPKTNASDSSPEVRQLLNFVSARLGRTISDPVEAWSEFIALPPVVQRPLVLDFITGQSGHISGTSESRLADMAKELADSLGQAGLAHNRGQGYDGGWDAIHKSFPARGYAGDLNLYVSQIKTADGGDIRLFVPGGTLNVGVSNASFGGKRNASELGIVAQDVGSIAVFVSGDVLVNQSRIFTLKGGDILIWSSTGSIDAGRGAKSAISAPKPKVTVSAEGAITFNYSGAVAGSGIRIINTDPSILAGSVSLIAPQGSVNAGDAGIGSAGTLNIAAVSVTGADNIQVSGTSTGVPTTDVGSLSVGFAGQADASASAAKGVQETLAESAAENSTAPHADRALAYLEVMIQGFGGDEANDSSDSE